MSDNLIIILLITIIILNFYQLSYQFGLIVVEKENLTPNNKYKIIINNIKAFYKQIAIKNKDFKSEIIKILNIKPIESFNKKNNFIVKYQLNNGVIGNRRFYINTNHQVLAMGKPL